MNIVLGKNFQEKANQLAISLRDVHEPLTIITEHVTYMEDLLLSQRDVLFNIEVKTLHQFEKDLLVERRMFKRHLYNQTQLVMAIRTILSHQDFTFFKISENPYPLIGEIITTLKRLHEEDIDLNTLPDHLLPLTKQKCLEINTIDQLLKQTNTYMNLEEATIDLVDQVSARIIVLGDDYPYRKQRAFFTALDRVTDVTMYLSHEEDDFVKSYYPGAISFVGEETTLTKHLYDQEKVNPIEKASVIIGGSPMHEVLKVTSDIKRRLVDEKAHYEDFMIVTHSNDMKDYLKDVFDREHIPHLLPETTRYDYDESYQAITKALASSQARTFTDLTNELLLLPLDENYRSLLKEVISDEEITPEEYLLFLQMIIPNKAARQPLHDAIMICDFAKALSVTPRYLYFLGLNEGEVPAVMGESGLLLEEDFLQLKTQPLSLSKQLSLHEMEIMKAILNPHKHLTFSYAQADMDGKEKMPSTLMKRLYELYDLENCIPDLTLHDVYLYLNSSQLPDYPLNEAIDHYDNKPVLIKEDYRHLLGKGMSVSRLETYNKCPFAYFMQYGLKVTKQYDHALAAYDIGHLAHYIMETSIDDEEHMKDHAYTYVKEHLQDKYDDNPLNQFFIDHMIDDMAMNLKIVKEQLGDFTIAAKEYEVTGDLGEIPVLGMIDRVDTIDDHVRIIDYKSSTKTLDLSFAMQGFNIQMLVYMDLLIKNKPDLKPGAVLYFAMKRRVITKALSKTLSLHKPLSDKDVFKQYRMEGYAFDEEPYDFCKQLVDSSTKVRIKKDGTPYSGAPILSHDQLKTVMAQIVSYMTALYEELRNGHIDILPAKADNNAAGIYPCDYCDYRSVCLFDVFVNENKVIKSNLKNEILKEEKQ